MILLKRAPCVPLTLRVNPVPSQEQDLLECHRRKDPCEGLVPIPEGQERACLLLEGKMNDIQITTAEKICLGPQNVSMKAMKGVFHISDWNVQHCVSTKQFFHHLVKATGRILGQHVA